MVQMKCVGSGNTFILHSTGSHLTSTTVALNIPAVSEGPTAFSECERTERHKEFKHTARKDAERASGDSLDY